MFTTMVEYKDRLETAMKASGTSHQKLADALGVSYQAVKKVTDGKSKAFDAFNNARAARILGVTSDWLALGGTEIVQVESPVVPSGYVRLEHLSPTPSMGKGREIDSPVQLVQHLDVFEQWVREKVGSTNPSRIKILTGRGNSMSPTINDGDLVFVDVECRSIEAAGIYVLDVAGRLILKKAMILSSGTLIIRSDNIDEYPDEERYDLRHIAEAITVCGKVMAWWSLRKG